MQNEMRERQMAMQIAWSREFLKYFGTFFGLATISLTTGYVYDLLEALSEIIQFCDDYGTVQLAEAGL